MTLTFVLTGLGWSLLFFVLLREADEKRARAQKRERRFAFSKGARRILWSLSMAPAIPMIVAGQYSAIVIWVGLASVLGWLLASAHKREVRAEPYHSGN